MLKINKALSVTLSLIAAFITGAALLVLIVAMPRILSGYIEFVGKPALNDSYGTMLALFYGGIVFAISAIAALIILLLCVRRGNVFTPCSVSCLRVISWACAAEGVIFAALGFFFTFSFVVAAAAFFMCILMRVVKNVIEEATAIKKENDFTI